MGITLLAGEEVVSTSNNGVLTLTNKRVRYESVVRGESQLVSITLNSVASCGLVTKSYPVLLILAAIAFLVSLGQRGGDIWVGMFIAVVLVIAYFVSRKSVISISSNGGEDITVPTKGMKRDLAVAFIDSLEAQILK